ncbi:MAG: ATP-binding cassette domain-containing protein, partial [Kineosporiaceae bacterium]
PPPTGATPGRTRPDADAALVAESVTAGRPGLPAAVGGVDLRLDGTVRTVAVVGPSGSGKSTLLATLAGLLPPLAGTVRVGPPGAAADPAEVPDAARRRLAHLVSESDHVFATSVRENLRLADPGAGDGRLARALVDAGLGAWLATLPQGLDTVLAPGGSDLSGGERRRLLLARARLSPAAVLLVDEPAEHLDPATADAVVGELLTGDRPVVVAGHRLTPLALADEVVVLRDGAVADRGRLPALLARDDELRRALAAESRRAPPEGVPA